MLPKVIAPWLLCILQFESRYFVMVHIAHRAFTRIDRDAIVAGIEGTVFNQT